MTAHKSHFLIRHQRIVDAQDDISFLQTSLSSRHIGIRLVYYHTIQFLMLADQGADSGILTCQHHPQVLCLILCIILSIRIQLTQHGVDARTDHILRIQRIDIE